MNPPPRGNPLWQEHLARLESLRRRMPPAGGRPPSHVTSITEDDADEARRGEWTAAPPGRLGRRLLADVEPYLAFFAIARTD